MSRTEFSAANVQAMVQELWSPMFQKELRAKNLLAGLVNKDYEGEIKRAGDTVKVSQIVAPSGQLLTVGTDADSFETKSLQSITIDVKADKRAVEAYEFEDLAVLMSQLKDQDSEIRETLLYAVKSQINQYIYDLVAPASGNAIVSADLDAAAMKSIRVQAGKQKWMKNKPWWLLADPAYHGDLFDATTMVSSDYVGDRTVETGMIARNRLGFNVLEDDSRGESAKEALAFHPDWCLLAMKTEPTFKISDQHSNKKFGYIISVDQVFGARLGIQGAEKHITVRPS